MRFYVDVYYGETYVECLAKYAVKAATNTLERNIPVVHDGNLEDETLKDFKKIINEANYSIFKIIELCDIKKYNEVDGTYSVGKYAIYLVSNGKNYFYILLAIHYI